jgi:hypothetical protein
LNVAVLKGSERRIVVAKELYYEIRPRKKLSQLKDPSHNPLVSTNWSVSERILMDSEDEMGSGANTIIKSNLS